MILHHIAPRNYWVWHDPDTGKRHVLRLGDRWRSSTGAEYELVRIEPAKLRVSVARLRGGRVTDEIYLWSVFSLLLTDMRRVG